MLRLRTQHPIGISSFNPHIGIEAVAIITDDKTEDHTGLNNLCKVKQAVELQLDSKMHALKLCYLAPKGMFT